MKLNFAKVFALSLLFMITPVFADTWQTDSAIASSLGDVGYNSAPTVFQKEGTWYLITGEKSGVFYGYNWTGYWLNLAI